MKSTLKDNGYQLACVQSENGPRMVPYKLVRSSRARRMFLQFDSPQYVTLKLPMRCSEKRGIRFIEEHGDWICQVLDKQPRVPELQKFLAKHPRLALAGRWHSLAMGFHQGSSGYFVDEEVGSVQISLNAALPVEKQLVRVLKEIARDHLTKRIHFLEDRVGVKAHGVTVRDQRSRWGSCSETGGISLNWRLILIAPKLQDHILLHELAHIRHFDHSRDFHAFLRSLDPQSDKHDRLLHKEAERVFPLGRSHE